MIFFEEPYTIFTIVGLVILGLSLIEIALFFFGFSFSKFFEGNPDISIDADTDIDLDVNTGIDLDGDFDIASIPSVGLFHLGQVPFFVVLLIVGMLFSVSGISLHYFAESLGISITNLLAIPGSILLSCIGGFYITKLFAKILPSNESYAVNLTELIGLEGEVVIGKGDFNTPVQIKVLDKYGAAHYIMTKAAIDGQEFSAGQKIILIESYPNGTFGSILKEYSDSESELELELGV